MAKKQSLNEHGYGYGGAPMTKARYIRIQMKRTWQGYLMVLPFTVIFIAFTVVPVVISIALSFTSFNMLEWPEWKGLSNYIQLFLADDLFVTAFANTMMFAVTTGPASFILSFIIAWFINELQPRLRALITIVFYAPSISGTAYTIWGVFFQSDIYGYVNGWLLKMGLIDSPIAFFRNTAYIVPLCIAVALWTSLGTGFLSNIAGLQGVDRSLYEAGAIDGVKNRWQEAWYITLPQMKNILMFGAVLAITGSFGFGAVVDTLCGRPSTDYVAWTLQHHLGEYMSTRFEYGYASAIAVVLFAIMMIANMLVQKFLSKVGQ
ncbi:MAG: sugar ABC transporter permease [Clostridia bacterium]|nr:sugar ABC transporter permease [Clostridia bacterium]MBQ7603785.1 sugar ABC transporter permease [Clostridia bacterium]